MSPIKSFYLRGILDRIASNAGSCSLWGSFFHTKHCTVRRGDTVIIKIHNVSPIFTHKYFQSECLAEKEIHPYPYNNNRARSTNKISIQFLLHIVHSLLVGLIRFQYRIHSVLIELSVFNIPLTLQYCTIP